MERKGNRQIYLGTVYATQEGSQWNLAPDWYKNNDNMVYEYFEGKSGDGPLVLKKEKRKNDGYNDQLFAVSVNLQEALFDRGLEMKRYDKEDDIYYAIAIYREHIRATTLWWYRNDGMEWTRADEYDTE